MQNLIITKFWHVFHSSEYSLLFSFLWLLIRWNSSSNIHSSFLLSYLNAFQFLLFFSYHDMYIFKFIFIYLLGLVKLTLCHICWKCFSWSLRLSSNSFIVFLQVKSFLSFFLSYPVPPAPFFGAVCLELRKNFLNKILYKFWLMHSNNLRTEFSTNIWSTWNLFWMFYFSK